jgi:hypothetical protein
VEIEIKYEPDPLAISASQAIKADADSVEKSEVVADWLDPPNWPQPGVLQIIDRLEKVATSTGTLTTR